MARYSGQHVGVSRGCVRLTILILSTMWKLRFFWSVPEYSWPWNMKWNECYACSCCVYLGLYLTLSFQMNNKNNGMKNVVIVGAGIAGLTCARELSKYNKHLNVTILEASDRIGGRVKSIKTKDGTTIEMGAQFIHGTVGNPIFDYAVEKGIISPFTRRGIND